MRGFGGSPTLNLRPPGAAVAGSLGLNAQAEDSYQKLPELMGLTMTLLKEIQLVDPIEPLTDPSQDTFMANHDPDFIYQGMLLKEEAFRAIHNGKDPYCTISVYKMNTDQPVILPAGTVSSVVMSTASVKGHNWKNGRYNYVSVQSYNDGLPYGAVYISTLGCTKPEPGLFRKSQFTSAEVVELTQGVVLFE